MRTMSRLLPLICAALLVAGCNQRTDKDEGTVILSISDFDGLPVVVGVNDQTLVQIGQIVVQNIAKDPNGITSDLMNVEIQSYEVIYSRADTGTRNPTPLVQGIFGLVTVGGTTQFDNLVIMSVEQTRNPPLSDLLFQNGGFDKETNSQVIRINFRIRFFGRTLSGDDIQTAPASFVVDFVPTLL